MPIVNANKTLTDELEIGRKLTVVVSSGGSASIRMYQAGQDIGGIQLSSGSTNSFGPFTSAINYAVDCFSGSANVNESQPSDDAIVLGNGPDSIVGTDASVGGGVSVAEDVYQPKFVGFYGGSNQNFIASGVLTGLTNISQGAARVIARIGTIAGGAFGNILGSSAGRFTIGIDNTGKMRVHLTDGTNTFIFRTTEVFANPTNPNADQNTKDFLFWWDTGFAAGSRVGKIYLANEGGGYIEAATEIVTDTGASFVNQYNNQTFGIGGTNLGANPYSGEIMEFMAWLSASSINSQDFTSATVQKRLNTSGEYQDVCLHGEGVTGLRPTLYFSIREGEAPSAFAINRGSHAVTWSRLNDYHVDGDMAAIGYGDSLMEGTGATLSGDRWFNQLSVSLSPKVKRINQGVGGETGAAIKQRFMRENRFLTKWYPNALWFIEGGYNNVANGVADMVLHSQEMADQLIYRLYNAKFLILGTPNGSTAGEQSGGARYNTIVAANAQLAALYGQNFLDIRVGMITSGLAIAGITPTSQDLIDIANDIVPSSLRADNIHHNNAGHDVYEYLVKERLTALGYI